jgi:multidrug resistance efflux pump
MTSINEQVAAKLADISPTVTGKVVDLLVEKEVNRRVELITQGLSKLNEFDRETRKLSKPDVEAFNADLTPAAPQFTKARVEEIKKHGEKVEKLTKALDKAIDSGDIGDLANLVK